MAQHREERGTRPRVASVAGAHPRSDSPPCFCFSTPFSLSLLPAANPSRRRPPSTRPPPAGRRRLPRHRLPPSARRPDGRRLPRTRGDRLTACVTPCTAACSAPALYNRLRSVAQPWRPPGPARLRACAPQRDTISNCRLQSASHKLTVLIPSLVIPHSHV